MPLDLFIQGGLEMVKSLSTLVPAVIEFDYGSKVVFLNIDNQRAYGLDGNQLADEEASAVFSAMNSIQEENIQEIPYDKIYEVMETEKRLSEDNSKHIFRRS